MSRSPRIRVVARPVGTTALTIAAETEAAARERNGKDCSSRAVNQVA